MGGNRDTALCYLSPKKRCRVVAVLAMFMGMCCIYHTGNMNGFIISSHTNYHSTVSGWGQNPRYGP